MFVAENLWAMLLSHITVIQITGHSIHTFSKDKSKISSSKSKTITIYKIKTYIGTLFILALALQVLYFHKCFPLIQKAQSLFFVLGYGSHMIITWMLLKEKDSLPMLVNSMVQFEKNMNPDGWVPNNGLGGKHAKGIMKPFPLSALAFATLAGTYIWHNTCFPGNLGFIFLQECSINGKLGFWSKFGSIIFQAWSVNFLIANGCYFLPQFLFCVGHCLTNYLLLCQKYCEGFSSKSEKSVLNCYAMIRVLIATTNQVCGGTYMFVVGTNTGCLIVSLFTILTLETSLAQFLFLSISTFDRFLLLKDAFGSMANINTESKKTLRKIREFFNMGCRQENRKLIKRIIASLPLLKAKMGTDNFFDKLFIATNANFIINQTASLLLLIV